MADSNHIINGIAPTIKIFLQNLKFFKAFLILCLLVGFENELETLVSGLSSLGVFSSPLFDEQYAYEGNDLGENVFDSLYNKIISI